MRDSPGHRLVKVVEVTWGDAFVSTSDISEKKAKRAKPVIRTTVGFLVAENDDGIVIAMDAYKGGGFNTYTLVPWGWIKEYFEYA